jgi:L-idonate 5-dehydrogenase
LSEARNVYPLPAHYPIRQAALIEPLAVVVRGLKRLGIIGQPQTENRSFLVFGDGPIGLIAMLLLRHFGLKDVTLAGGRAPRLDLAASLGANQTINYHDCGPQMGASILEQHHGPFSIVIEASGSATAMAAAIDLTARDGKVLVMGDYGAGQASFLWNSLLHSELTLVGSNASAGAWQEAVDLAVQARLPLDKLISHQFPAHQFQQGYELTRGRGPDVVKVVLDWEA